MTKGTPSQGKRSGKRNHISCRRCGQVAYNVSTKVCSSCGYGKSPRMRAFAWSKKN